MRPGREDDKRFPRDVRQILDGGITWADNVGPVVSFTYNSTNLPARVQVPVTTEPLAVLVVRAALKSGGDGFRASFNRIGWYWRSGVVEVSVIDDLASSTDYTVTLALLMG